VVDSGVVESIKIAAMFALAGLGDVRPVMARF
jgi:mannose/fructose/N-acetylgalactosamine-specific phosphotransferase system component IID